MNKIKLLWDYLRASLWFIPIVVVLISIILALVLVQWESPTGADKIVKRFWLYGLGAQEARILLSTIAGSMMTIVGITFSMTLITLALASSQYTSRILRNFMRSRLTQMVIGIFIGIFTYCLIILCTIREGPSSEFIPSLAVLFAFLSALGGAWLLIFFIHHIASSIQASSILSSIGEETLETMDRIYPKTIESETDAKNICLDKKEVDLLDWFPILSTKKGYLQNIDKEKLKKLAIKEKLVVRVEHKVGEFVVLETPLAYLTIEPNQETIDSVNSAFIFSHYRELGDDVSFGIRQLVDIALKALSPGINDTTTAVMCLNYLTVILVQLTNRTFNSSLHYEGNELCLITQDHHFGSLLKLAFNQIRENGKENSVIILKMIESLRLITEQTKKLERLKALKQQTWWINEMIKSTIKLPHHLEEINKQLSELFRTSKLRFRSGASE